MKKIALLLAMLMLFTFFATSCKDDSEHSDASDASATSENQEESKAQSEAELIKTGIKVSDNPAETVVSTGKSYVKSAEAGKDYPDTYGTELTDSVRTDPAANNYADETLSGYTISGKRVNIDVDLGYECDKLYSFKVGYLSTSEAGIAPPASIQVFGSLNGKKWTLIGNLAKPEYIEGTMQEAVGVFNEYVNARYIRFTVRGSSSWTFLDEVIIIADVEGSSTNGEYLEAVNNAYQQLGSVAVPNNGADINRDLDKTLISKDKNYTFTGETVEAFPDKGSMLTDGKLSGFYEGETWVGFKGGADASVKIDLGETVTDISSVEATFFANTAVGLYMPVALKIAAIDDSNTRTELGILYGNAILKNGEYTYVLPFSKSVSARYIEITMVATESKMYLVEEIAVYAYREAVESTMYPELVIDTNTRDASGSTANKNLIAGKTQQITASNDPEEKYFANNTPVTSTLMTDGQFSSGMDIHDGRYFKFNLGGGRKVLYDLDYVRGVKSFTASFTNRPDWGVYAPSTVTVFLSSNGKDWYEAGVMTISGKNESGTHNGELKLSKKVKARYVVFSFAVKTWTGCDELEVFGSESASGATATEKAGLTKKVLFENERIQPSADMLGGAKDLVLLYHGTKTQYTAEDLIPYLAYVDKEGAIQDTMFDSFLFLLTSSFPSGAPGHKDSKMSDWQWAIDDVLTENENICALDTAAGQVKEALALPADYKYKVTMTLYYPTEAVTGFGDVDGDGVVEDFSKQEDRLKAFKWYIKAFEDKFASFNFENIELVGYYWYHEAMVDGEADLKLLNSVSDLVHSYNRTFFWIPYFQSNGYNAWAEYGFDIACMQPNYVFKAETPYSNVITTEKLTELYGMGIEMEVCSESLTDELFFKKYMQYISAGAEFGYMNDTVVMYYQSVFDYRNAANSKTYMGRAVYDQTYHFIKGDVKFKPDTLEKSAYESVKNEIYFGEIKFADEKLREFRLEVAPEHGSVTLNGDGTFTFYPEKDFSGEVTFKFAYSEYLGWSDLCEVSITVK